MFDVVIKGGTVVDGTGAAPRIADVAITDGRIVEVGPITAPARREIQAEGLLVTPGFIDIHTHYDGQALWDDALYPSFNNGVTTAILGNCGVGFAPLRPGQQDVLIDLMDGVEEIPGGALTEGLDWKWESFPDYLNRLDQTQHSFNIGAHIAHGPLRFYVMGDKVQQQKCPDDAEREEMARLLDEALHAGAFGLTSSRTSAHRSALGLMTPDFDADLPELMALGEVVGRHKAVFEFAPQGVVGEDLDGLRQDMGWYERIALETNARVHVIVAQTNSYPDFWREQFDSIDRVNANGGDMYAQVSGRCVTVMLGFHNNHPFLTRPGFIEVSKLPRDQWLQALSQPEVKARILSETDNWPERIEFLGRLLPRAYLLGPSQNYEPTEDDRLAVVAERRGVSLEEAAYDAMLADGEGGFLYCPGLNYAEGSLDVTHNMLSRSAGVLALSDAGAHVQTVCDGAVNTFVLSFWGRDRKRGPKFPIEQLVHMITAKPAAAIGITDRGIIAPGYAADINVIDFETLKAEPPRIAYDLPSGAARLLQTSHGYRATLVGGVVTRENDQDTGARPGRLLRRAA